MRRRAVSTVSLAEVDIVAREADIAMHTTMEDFCRE